MNAQELYRAGKLSEAVTSQNEEVRAHPSDVARRSFLGELLCIAGNLDRADAQLEAIERMQPGSGPALALVRQLVRAEKTRQEVHGAGRAPEFLAAPPEHAQLALRARAALRAGHMDELAELVAAAEEARPEVAGSCDGARFEDFRDLDDLLGGVFEILTSTGRCLWIPIESVAALEFDAPTQPLDLLWRPAALAVKNGPEGKVFFPAVYCGASDGVDDAARLGRRTDWVQAGSSGAMQGIGLRTYLVGDDARTVLEVTRIAFDGAAA